MRTVHASSVEKYSAVIKQPCEWQTITESENVSLEAHFFPLFLTSNPSKSDINYSTDEC